MVAWFLNGLKNLKRHSVIWRSIPVFISAFIPLALYVAYLSSIYLWKPVLLAAKENYVLVIEKGDSVTKIANKLYKDKLIDNKTALLCFAKLRNLDKHIHVGEYKITSTYTLHSILNDIASGNVINYSFTIIEGETFADMMAEFARNPKIKVTLQGLSDQEIKNILQIKEEYLDGLFMPETYYYEATTTDVAILLRAKQAMQDFIATAWAEKQQNTVLKSPYEALILASIIQKESNIKDEYADVSAVYHRRLEQNMRLQADPTVVYGLKELYKGKLYLKHLKHDSVFNTYRKSGLPPAPIASPSRDAINAALHPSNSDALYFVAIGDGRHKFSKTLQEHNRAVSEYHAKRKQKK